MYFSDWQKMSKKTASDCSQAVNSSLVVPLDFLNALANTTTPDDLFHAIAEWLPRILPADLASAIPVANSPEAPDLSKDVDALFRDLDLDD